MHTDEEAIQSLLSTWHEATVQGDVATLLTLMAEDVVFLVSGQPPMSGRDAFAVGFKKALQQVAINYTWKTNEIQVAGELAYCWNELFVTMTPRNGGPPIQRRGPTLTILRKEKTGNWVLFRDANLLATQP